MILTLTLNPAIDVTLSVDRINYDDRSLVTGEAEDAGGKGINSARVVHAYGGSVHAISTRGGAAGDRFAGLLDKTNLPKTLIPVHGETRLNYAVTDRQGLTIKIDHQGQRIGTDELEAIVEAVSSKLPQAQWLMLTGSLPPEVPMDFYARLIERAHRHGVPTLLDTSGPALREGLAARPAIAKPNRPEAERLLDRTLLTQAQAAEAADQIRQMGADRVILSLGSQGALAAWEDGLLRAVLPLVATGCPIGAGDVLGATCVWALGRGHSFTEALSWAVAAATAAAARPGLSFAPLKEVEAMRERVEIRPI